MHLTVRRLFSNSIWKPIPTIPPDNILFFNIKYNEEKNPNKVNLTIGAYRDENGKPWILPSVKLAKAKLEADKNHNYEYIRMEGDHEFTKLAVKLAYGEKNGVLGGKYNLDQISRVQSLSGAGGVYLGFELAKKFYSKFDGNIYVPEPTWPIHNSMAELHGLKAKKYRYYDLAKREFNYQGMIEDLKQLPEYSFVLYHPAGHNPTGFDPSPEQWKEILEITMAKKFLVIFDMAYQGFVSGDPDKDAYALRLFAENGINTMLSQSFAKNFGLYGHRIGCFSVLNESAEEAQRMSKYLGYITRNTYSSCPRFGSDIIRTILSDQEMTNMWRKDIVTMSNRITRMRHCLFDELDKNGVKDNWDYILKQRGMFAFTHLQKHHVQSLREQYAIYMLENGRMSLSGLNENNVAYVGKAIANITK